MKLCGFVTPATLVLPGLFVLLLPVQHHPSKNEEGKNAFEFKKH